MGLDMYLYAKKEFEPGSDPGDKVRGMLADVERFNDSDGVPYAFLSGYSFAPEKERDLYPKVIETLGVTEYIDAESPTITIQFHETAMVPLVLVGYWRKANQVHTWFVENVQDGVDECQESPCSREQLQSLRDLCSEVLSHCEMDDGMVWNGSTWEKEGEEVVKKEIYEPGKVLVDSGYARSALPTSEGFFFGSTDYDEGYVLDLTMTVQHIDRALSMPDDWSFVYHASW